jgi:hypothetical protein
VRLQSKLQQAALENRGGTLPPRGTGAVIVVQRQHGVVIEQVEQLNLRLEPHASRPDDVRQAQSDLIQALAEQTSRLHHLACVEFIVDDKHGDARQVAGRPVRAIIGAAVQIRARAVPAAASCGAVPVNPGSAAIHQC